MLLRTSVVALLSIARGAAPPTQAQERPARTATEPSPSEMPSVQQLLEPGPEARELESEAGTWEVTMTVRPTPDAKPSVVSGMTAERVMVGPYLAETMRPAPDSELPEFRRLDYLTYDRLQARWEYASMDTRAPIGIMFARSSSGGSPKEITVYFENFANPGLGDVGGSVRARHVDTRESKDRTFKRQYWTRPGGSEWLAIQYEYRRKR
jgi:hypothetical protein